MANSNCHDREHYVSCQAPDTSQSRLTSDGLISWRTELPPNQAIFAKEYFVWNGFKFRSREEIRVAQALERANIFPELL
jgi:hypothetical protein